MYGNLIYTVIYMSDRLLTQANPNPRMPLPPDLRSKLQTSKPSAVNAGQPGVNIGSPCYLHRPAWDVAIARAVASSKTGRGILATVPPER